MTGWIRKYTLLVAVFVAVAIYIASRELLAASALVAATIAVVVGAASSHLWDRFVMNTEATDG
ncbi:MAG: hypothetical protein QNI87_04725 [Erythrobacter sp.]|uniref:hypothetical protein n=1 Tax=Erythrobacter sp. TaxID=1042 RepID=UPI0026045C5D|nr:hypothetical protein [Erythrobacter sp.]MDJ0977819.1 hypothetical protein [Erythrobacter sp.]